ncbi:Protein of unknown function [Lactobacillus delbrueckii subsp. lactis]|nr:Protein of unknown function [Lactobacillus delbrueckii subsp. lactis]
MTPIEYQNHVLPTLTA